jgi:hypothetical protein
VEAVSLSESGSAFGPSLISDLEATKGENGMKFVILMFIFLVSCIEDNRVTYYGCGSTDSETDIDGGDKTDETD